MREKTVGGRLTHTARPHHPMTTTEDSAQTTALGRQLRRRREAALRLVPLDCGCSDPWLCHCDDVLTDSEARAWIAAIDHLTRLGLIPLVDIETCRALWRHGEHDLAWRLAHFRGAA